VVSPAVVTKALASTVLDVCCVLAFVAIGRHTHHDGAGIAGVWHTAWPFLAGLAIGLGAARAWRRPLAVVPAGLGAWLGAALAGMALRVLAGQGTALTFIGVTLAFLGLFILGWRVVARIVATRLLAAR
jgi:GNAT superfamily N-acetyltransferase